MLSLLADMKALIEKSAVGIFFCPGQRIPVKKGTLHGISCLN
jgi:hypothetical protein